MWKLVFSCVAVAVAIFLDAAAATGAPAVPIPQFTGPIPAAADSYPYLADDHDPKPLDLQKSGYLEEEFFVSGTANVYTWARSGAVGITPAHGPYTIRILVRRPRDPAKFSGNVIVEDLSDYDSFDHLVMWGDLYPYMLEHGDAYVGVTVSPRSIENLKKFNPARYAPLSMESPTLATIKCYGYRRYMSYGYAVYSTGGNGEQGLRWDAISQVAALLKSNRPGRPLADLRVAAVYQTSQDRYVNTYVNTIDRGGFARLADGKPAYDGYLLKWGVFPEPISECAEFISWEGSEDWSDPRLKIGPRSSPLIQVQEEGDFPEAYHARRADSDRPDDRYRLYEIAGASHGGNGGGPVPDPRCTPPRSSPQPMAGHAIRSALSNLELWVRNGTPPPRAARLQVKDLGPQQPLNERDRNGFRLSTPEPYVVVRDALGNALGGARSPYVDVPIAAYHGRLEGLNVLACGRVGWTVPFDKSRLTSLYGDSETYKAKLQQAVDRSVKERWLNPSDVPKVLEELTAVHSFP
jgi:Alpha/beta hydrolase domain